MNISEVIRSRRSIRKYLPDPVSTEQLEALIDAAVHAPSGCNSQCWHFTAIRSADRIEALAMAVEEGVRRVYSQVTDLNFLAGRLKQSTFFRKAPLVLCVFMTEMNYHDPRVEEYYGKQGIDHAGMLRLMGDPNILSIGAAVENLLLKAVELGLGACWMNDPVIAEPEIKALLHTPSDYRLMSIVPVGYSAYTPRTKPMKPVDSVLEIL